MRNSLFLPHPEWMGNGDEPTFVLRPVATHVCRVSTHCLSDRSVA